MHLTFPIARETDIVFCKDQMDGTSAGSRLHATLRKILSVDLETSEALLHLLSWTLASLYQRVQIQFQMAYDQ